MKYLSFLIFSILILTNVTLGDGSRTFPCPKIQLSPSSSDSQWAIVTFSKTPVQSVPSKIEGNWFYCIAALSDQKILVKMSTPKVLIEKKGANWTTTEFGPCSEVGQGFHCIAKERVVQVEETPWEEVSKPKKDLQKPQVVK